MHKVLIVDDDVAVTNYLMVFLAQTEIYDSTVINDSRQVAEALENIAFDAVILDMDMPNVSGLEILQFVKDKRIATPIIVLTGVADVDLAVSAMKLGAFDYLTKPVDDEHLLEVLNNAVKYKSIHRSINQLPQTLSREDLTHKEAFKHLPTQDPAMIRVFHLAEKMAAGDLSIFIWGESGTGKESLARAIHEASPRRNGPFIAVDAAAQTPSQFPAQFFGQARDWSGVKIDAPGFLEEASGGTLFLDNIEYLSLPMQERLKNVIKTGEFYREGSTRIQKVNVRFIVASNHDLTGEEYISKFSRDLLYHLMINTIKIPPLRERKDDIPLIAKHFLDEEAAKIGKNITGISPELIAYLKEYSFPNNLQELRDIIAACVVNTDGDTITIDSVPPHFREILISGKEKLIPEFKPRKLIEIEREYVQKMLEYFGYDKERTALELGISLAEMAHILESEK